MQAVSDSAVSTNENLYALGPRMAAHYTRGSACEHMALRAKPPAYTRRVAPGRGRPRPGAPAAVARGVRVPFERQGVAGLKTDSPQPIRSCPHWFHCGFFPPTICPPEKSGAPEPEPLPVKMLMPIVADPKYVGCVSSDCRYSKLVLGFTKCVFESRMVERSVTVMRVT